MPSKAPATVLPFLCSAYWGQDSTRCAQYNRIVCQQACYYHLLLSPAALGEHSASQLFSWER